MSAFVIELLKECILSNSELDPLLKKEVIIALQSECSLSDSSEMSFELIYSDDRNIYKISVDGVENFYKHTRYLKKRGLSQSFKELFVDNDYCKKQRITPERLEKPFRCKKSATYSPAYSALYSSWNFCNVSAIGC